MIKTKNLVPNVYYDESRDFQVLGRTYELIFNYMKSTADMVETNPLSANSDDRMLDLLSLTLGFKSKHHYSYKQLRILCECLSEILKCKGTVKSVELALNILMKAENINKAAYRISIDTVVVRNPYVEIDLSKLELTQPQLLISNMEIYSDSIGVTGYTGTQAIADGEVWLITDATSNANGIAWRRWFYTDPDRLYTTNNITFSGRNITLSTAAASDPGIKYVKASTQKQISIYIEEDIKDLNLFYDLLDYILPAGMNCVVYRGIVTDSNATTVVPTSDPTQDSITADALEYSCVPGFNSMTHNREQTAPGAIDNTTIVTYPQP